MNAPERTMKKIEKEQAKLDALIGKRDELTASYQSQLAKMNEGIEETTKTIEALRKQEKNEKLVAVAAMLNKNSVSVDELYEAAMRGDFYSLQERLEQNPQTENESTATAEVAEEEPVAEETASEAENPVVEENAYFEDNY